MKNVVDWNQLKNLIIELENRQTAIPPKQEEGDITCYCAVCKEPVIITDNYCHNCGQKLREDKEHEIY